jgi:hypothetical protein
MTQKTVSEAWFPPGTFYSHVSTQLLRTHSMTTLHAT